MEKEEEDEDEEEEEPRSGPRLTPQTVKGDLQQRNEAVQIKYHSP